MKTIEMPEVMQCKASGCVYNKNEGCHARAITVGDEQGHWCDTMMQAENHTDRAEEAGVGACRAADCKFNQDYECQASNISVTMRDGQAECMTFAAA